MKQRSIFGCQWLILLMMQEQKGIASAFLAKESSATLSSYFMKCFQMLADAGKRRNPIIVNINANGEFLNCEEVIKFKRVSKSIANELRGEGYMVSWGGPLWRELFTVR